MRPLRILRAGVEEYEIISDTMRRMQQQRIDDEIPDTLILVEHPEIVTIGPKAIRDGVNVDGYPTSVVDRGGGITYHGKGQLVGYPIIKWENDEQSVRGIINKIENWMMAAFEDCGIGGYRDERMMGVWLGGYKVASIGLAFKHWVSRHGFAINYNIPANRIESLPCCGLNTGMTTSLSRLGHPHDLEGRIIDRIRLEEALLVTCEQYINRSPMIPIDWNAELNIQGM